MGHRLQSHIPLGATPLKICGKDASDIFVAVTHFHICAHELLKDSHASPLELLGSEITLRTYSGIDQTQQRMDNTIALKTVQLFQSLFCH